MRIETQGDAKLYRVKKVVQHGFGPYVEEYREMLIKSGDFVPAEAELVEPAAAPAESPATPEAAPDAAPDAEEAAE